VTKVDLRHHAEALTLTFCGAEGLAAELTLQRQDRRQWLNILYDAWRAAGWPAGVWPEWMEAQAAPPPTASQARLH
jgi:hypothetical protein